MDFHVSAEKIASQSRASSAGAGSNLIPNGPRTSMAEPGEGPGTCCTAAQTHWEYAFAVTLCACRFRTISFEQRRFSGD